MYPDSDIDVMQEAEQMFTPNRDLPADFASLTEGGEVTGSEQCEQCGNCVYVRRGNYMVCVTDEDERELTGYEGCGAKYKIVESFVNW